MPPPLLQLIAVGKSYGPVRVLSDVGFAVAANEFLTILGPSGSGKTTILRLIGGFEEADEGRVVFEGRDISGLPVNRRPFNTVFQDYALFPHMSVRRNVGYGLMVRGRPKAEVERRVRDVLGVVGLERFADRFPGQLSGGQRQRVALARAIVCEPRLILLDEPLAALDVELRAQMRGFLKDLQRRLGIAFLFITHDQEEAITLSDRIVVMREGRIEQVGAPPDLYYRPRTAFVAGFLGENNLLRGRVVEAAGASGLGVECPLGVVRAGEGGAALRPGSPVLLAFRPESVEVRGSGEPGPAGENRVEGTVGRVLFAGPSEQVEVAPAAAPDLRLKVRAPSRAAGSGLRVGDLVTLAWRALDTAVIEAAGHG